MVCMMSCCSGTGSRADRRAVPGEAIAVRDNASKVAPACLLISFDRGNAFSDPVTLGFGDGRQNGEDQFADAAGRDVAPEVDHVQADIAFSSDQPAPPEHRAQSGTCGRASA